MSTDLPVAGTSIGAGPGAVQTVAAEEIGYELVNRCTVEFIPRGERALIRGRLLELVQPLPNSPQAELREPGLEEATTLYVVPAGSKHAVAFPVPTHTPVTVRVDSV